jgi:hypothetical protein
VTDGQTITGGVSFDSPMDSPLATNATNSPEPARTGFKLKIKQPMRPIVPSDSESDED